jgi:hypothetical protein
LCLIENREGKRKVVKRKENKGTEEKEENEKPN